jgi:ubiquinol-cytochrome c reductase cytochrome b subunit
MMIKLAKNAEANAKLQPKKPSSSAKSINLPQNWIFVVFIALIAFQVYLNIAAYYAVLAGMKNYSLFIVGIMMLVFAGMWHLFRHGRSMEKAPPPKPVVPPSPLKAKPTPAVTSPTPPLALESGGSVKPVALGSPKEEKPIANPAPARGASATGTLDSSGLTKKSEHLTLQTTENQEAKSK